MTSVNASASLFRRFTSQAVKIIMMGAVFTALFSCSSEPVNPPAELTEFQRDVYAKRLWKRPVGVGGDERELEFQALLSNNTLVTVDAEGRLNAVDATTGWRQWRTDLDEQIIGGLAEDSRNLYFSSYSGEFIAFNKVDRKVVWRQQLSSEVLSPAGTDGRFVAVQSINDSVVLFDALEGKKLWQHDQETPLLSLRGTSSPVIYNDIVITSFANGELIAFAVETGEILWRYTIANASGRTELERLVDADGPPVIDGNIVFSAAFQGAIAAVDLRTGAEVWNKPLSSASAIAVDGDDVYATLDDGSIVALNKRNGDELWRSDQMSYRRLGAPKVSSGLLVTDDFEGYVHILRSQNGELIGRVRPDSDGVMGDLILLGHQLFAYSNDGHIVAYHLLQ